MMPITVHVLQQLPHIPRDEHGPSSDLDHCNCSGCTSTVLTAATQWHAGNASKPSRKFLRICCCLSRMPGVYKSGLVAKIWLCLGYLMDMGQRARWSAT